VGCLALPWGFQGYRHPSAAATMAVHPLSLADRAVQVGTQMYCRSVWEQCKGATTESLQFAHKLM